MKKMVTAFSIIALASFSHGAMAQANANATAKINIISALNLTNNTVLDFGDYVQGDTGAKTVAAGDPESANFSVSGNPNSTYNIVLPSTPVVMSTNGGGPNQEINVQSFTSDKVGNSSTLDGSGNDTFNVGGETAALLGSELAGEYTGQFSVTVAY